MSMFELRLDENVRFSNKDFERAQDFLWSQATVYHPLRGKVPTEDLKWIVVETMVDKSVIGLSPITQPLGKHNIELAPHEYTRC